jgi:putative membrane protein
MRQAIHLRFCPHEAKWVPASAGTTEWVMRDAANAVIMVVALLHLYFMALEMFFWTKPLGRRAFGLSAEFAEASKRLAANQGLYNGFLAAGLLWGIWLGDAGFAIKLFFLACVLVAGVFGALTVSRKVLWVQAVPAAIAIVLLWLAY